MRIGKFAFAFAWMLVVVEAAHAVIDVDSKTFTAPGEWTLDLNGVKKYAKDEGQFFLIAYGRQGGGCGNCNAAAVAIYNTPVFKSWAKENHIALYVADADGKQNAGTWVTSTYNNGGGNWKSFPILILVDPDDGVSSLGLGGPKGSMPMDQYTVGDSVELNGTSFRYGYFSAPFAPETIIGWVDFALAARNNEVNQTGNQKYHRMNHSAVEVVPSEADAEPDVCHLWKNYGDWHLVSTNYWVGREIKSYHSDLFDWFKFNHADAGTSYKVTTPLMTGGNVKDLRLCFYETLDNARAATDFASAVSNAVAVFTADDIAAGNAIFTPSSTGTKYFAFTLRTPEVIVKEKKNTYEEMDVTYNFTLQKCNAEEFWFEKQVWTGYEGETNRIAVVRSSDVGKASVEFSVVGKDDVKSVTSVNPSNYDQASEGATNDYYVVNADGTANTDRKVDFADGVLTNYIYVVSNRGEIDVHSRNRAFGLTLDSEVSEEGRYVEAFVAIEDADAEKTDTDGEYAAGSEQQELKGFLNKDDEQDVYSLTNASSQVGSIYGFSVDFDMARDFQAGKIYVKAVRNGSGQSIGSRAGRNSQILADGRVEVGARGYAFFLFGSDSETGGDVEITVSRDAAANGEFPTVRYRLAWRRFDRPGVGFENVDEKEIQRDGMGSSYNLPVTANTIAPITNYVKEAFALNVHWCTTTNEVTYPAVAGRDYEAVATTNCIFTSDSASVSVNVLSRDALLHPELTFKATLLDDTENYMYYVDEAKRSVPFKFKADPVDACAPITVDVGESGWQSTGERSLNYTNIVDWIAVTNVAPCEWEHEYTTNYVKTVTNDVIGAKIEVVGEGSAATTNFTAKVEEISVDYTDTVRFDGSLETVTNSVGYLTNDYSVVAVDEVKEVTEETWPAVATIMAKRLKGESTVRVSDTFDSRVVQRTCYRLRATDLVVKPETQDVGLTVDVCTNKADDAVALYSYNLKNLVFDDSAQSPVVWFDALGDEAVVWLRVSRNQDETVFAQYDLSLREWRKPEFRFAETSVETNDTVATFNLTLLREGNVSDEVTVKVVSSNETAVADGDYFSVPEKVTFSADSAMATLQVTVSDPTWNALAWTGDRTFCLSLAEVYSDVGAFDFSETSNKTTVVLRETNGSGLDEADGFDEVRADVTTNDVAVAIAEDGTLTNLVRTLNGCAADGYVNDTNDWFRFTGIVAGETYCFKAVDCLVSNTDVTAEFYIGDATAPTNLTTLAGLEAGWRYTAETNADVFVRILRGRSDKVASVNYTLVVYKYIWPVVGFTTGSIVVTNTDLKGAVALEVFKRLNTNEAITVNFHGNSLSAKGWEADNVFAGMAPESVVFPEGVENVGTNVNVSVASAEIDVWTGDWKYNVYLSAEPGKVRFGDYTNVTITVVDNRVPRTDDGRDPEDDTAEGAVEYGLGKDGALSATNHLNGIDVKHYGVMEYTDTNDWLRITGIEAENTYRITIANVIMENIDATNLFVEVRSPKLMVTNTYEDIGVTGILVPCQTAEDILVRVGRATVNDEVPVSVKYELNVERIDWPCFTISAAADSVVNDSGTATLVVTRADNLDATNAVVMTLADANDVKVVSGVLERTLVFEPGVTCITQEVVIVGAENGFWKRGGEFSAALTRATDDPYVTIGDPSNVVVTVVDASGILANDYPADDTRDGAQAYEFSKDMMFATNYCNEGQAASAIGANWLNGSDTNDWYRFTGTTTGKKYRFEMSGVDSVNAADLAMGVTVYDAQMNKLGSTNLVEFAKWDFVAEDADGFFVCVHRGYDVTRDVSVRYVLSFREAATIYAKFLSSTVSVSEAADAVYVDVICITELGEQLEEDTVVEVVPEEDPDAAYPARANEDFDPTPVEVLWQAGSTGGVVRVAISLANYDNVWEGDETFLLTFATNSDNVEFGTPDKSVVTITDKDDPAYGTVGITDYGETTVREGGVFPVEFTRVNGDAGAVTGKFSWVVGKAKTEQTVVLFEDREGGAKTVELDVPENAAFALSQSATLTFALVAAKNTVALTKGSPTKVALTVMAANYGGKVADYADGDATKPAFRAADTAWYAGSSGGTLVAATPAKAGGTSAMSVPLTGPCTLTFDAVFANAANCRLLVKDGSTALATLTETTVGAEVVIEAYGTKTIQFVFERGKTGTSDTASVEISNISVVRSDDANRIGTYTGVAEIGGVPGFATMTVAANGKLSAKFACADRTWTVSGKNPWLDDVFTAKSGGATMPVAFALDAAAGTVEVTSGDAVIATLSRNCWGDKPLSAAAAAALEKFVGYYTVVLVPEDGGGYGSGYLGVTVGKNGSVKASGVLADGQSVTMAGTLAIDADGNVTVPLFAKPSAYRGGWYAATLVFAAAEGGAPYVFGARCTWARYEKNGGARFERVPGISGGWYDKAENLYDRYMAGVKANVEESVVRLSFSESGSKLMVSSYDGLFTVSFVRRTGMFSGNFREYVVDASGRQVRKSYQYRGMLTPNAAEGDAAGRGFFLRGQDSVDVSITK